MVCVTVIAAAGIIFIAVSVTAVAMGAYVIAVAEHVFNK